MSQKEKIEILESIGFRPIGAYQSTATGISWSKDEAFDKVYNNPEFRWSTSDLVPENKRYSLPSIVTMLGKTHLKNPGTGKYYYLVILDTDSQIVYNRLSIPIRQILDNSSWDWITSRLRELLEAFLKEPRVDNGNYEESLLDVFKKSGYVTKTRKEYGYHIPWLDTQQRRAIGAADCKTGRVLEIKVDNRLGLCTLPDSPHREDPTFRYKAVGQTDRILRSTIVYDLFVEMFRDCFINSKLDDDDVSSSENDDLKDKIQTMISVYPFKIDTTIKIPVGIRHSILLFVANSLFSRHWRTTSHDKLKNAFIDINNQLCKPDPLPEDEVEQIWKDAIEYQRRQQRQREQQEEAKNNDSKKVWIPTEVVEALKAHKWAFKKYNPTMTFVVAESRLNQTLEACAKSIRVREDPNNPNSQMIKKYYLSLRTIHINAIPIEVTTFEDPISVTLDQRYKIKFRTSLGKIFTSRAHSTLDAIIAELVDKALVYSVPEGKEALSRIVNAFENDGSIKVSREIETPGFYLIDGRIKAFQMDIKEYSQKDLAKAAHFMNELVNKHHRKEIPATTKRWGTIAPFNYVLKQYTDDLCWIPWLGFAGWPRSGKGTQGRIACGIWGDFYRGGIKNYLPFTAINTEARLGQKLGECTLPKTFNECDALNDDKNRNILEMIKNCVETRVSRGKYQTRTTYVDEPALSPCIITSNPAFPSELGFRTRIIYIVYTKNDKYWSESEAKDFTAFMSKGRKHLKVYGHFVARYILDNPQVLLKENIEDCDWKQASEYVLQGFYKAAGLHIPEWIGLFVDETKVTETAIQEANDTSYFELRGFFIQSVNNAYRIDPLREENGLRLDVNFKQKLDQCLYKNLIPYLHDHYDRAGVLKVVLTHDIIAELKRHKISNITTMQELAREISGFEYGPLYLKSRPMRAVHGLYQDFVKFVDCEFNEEKD